LLPKVDKLNDSLPISELKGFCRQWGINEFALFGSILRSDFDEESDIDIMISFYPNIRRNLFDHVQMQQELAQMLGRSVDLVTRRAVERSANWRIRENILSSAQILFEHRK